MIDKKQHLRWILMRGTVTFVLCALVLVTVTFLKGCRNPQQAQLPQARSLSVEPVVRVRIVRGENSVRIEGPRHVRITPMTPQGRLTAAPTSTQGQVYPTPLTIAYRSGRFSLTPPDGRSLGWQVGALAVSSDTGRVRIAGSDYPGAIALHPAPNTSTGIDAVNHVGIETYLPGVLQKELYPNWHPNAFAAQAVAARTYALYNAHLKAQQHYDLESTTASQAYIGVATNPLAINGARQTRGVVLTWSDRIFPAYYSSSTGGSGQDAAIAFPTGPNIPPLRGRDQGAWSSNSKYYRWGPIRRDANLLSRRIAAWGRSNRNAVMNLQTLRRIHISARNSTGRPAAFELTDSAGRTYTMSPEAFRHACNYTGSGLAEVPGDAQIRSSHVTVTVTGGSVLFTDGRGFGHGVGLDQHGTQSMALRGYTHQSILAFYYPQSQLKQIY